MNEVSMDKIVVYFHGYGSTPTGDKLDRLKNIPNTEAFAFPIDLDPEISFPALEEAIDHLLADNYRDSVSLIFVGTSLGAWYASKFAAKYGCSAVIINPCYNPSEMLIRRGLAKDLLDKYAAHGPMNFNRKFKYYVAVHDEVINFVTSKHLFNGLNVVWDAYENHRFNGKGFDAVCEHIAKM